MSPSPPARWRLLRSGAAAPDYNLALDSALLSSHDDRAVLRLYAWNPAALSLGWFQPIEALAPLIGHVQIAGVPDRHEPDSGELSLGHFLAALDRAGYDGCVGAEYTPAGRTGDGLGWFAPFARTRC